MAKKKYVAAGINNYFGGAGEQGIVFGQFRTLEFARQARNQILKEARRLRWIGHRGIFLAGKLLEEI